MLLNYLKLLRVKHWIKNILVLLPLFFSLNFTLRGFIIGAVGFIIFSLASSIVYIINDINDVKNDQAHPVKKYRPIAAGYFSIRQAYTISTVLLVVLIVIFICLKVPLAAILIICVYVALNIGYSMGLKNIPILDIFILALGFVLRVAEGSTLLNIELSNWLLLTVLCGSLYMGIGKRRNELMQQKGRTRPVNKFYSLNFLNSNLYVFMTLIICFYSLWTIDPVGNKIYNVIYTVPLVVVILMTYSLRLEDKQCDGDPVNVLTKDKSLLILSGVYVLCLLFLVVL